MQQFVGDDGVVHPHTAFVEDTHDGLLALELAGEFAAKRLSGTGELHVPDGSDMTEIVRHALAAQPLPQSAQEKLVGEIGAP